MNRSDINLRTNSVSNNDGMIKQEEVYIKTDDESLDNPINRDIEVRSISVHDEAAKSKRSAIDQISYDGLAVHSKKNSDPEPRSGDAITKANHRK